MGFNWLAVIGSVSLGLGQIGPGSLVTGLAHWSWVRVQPPLRRGWASSLSIHTGWPGPSGSVIRPSQCLAFNNLAGQWSIIIIGSVHTLQSVNVWPIGLAHWVNNNHFPSVRLALGWVWAGSGWPGHWVSVTINWAGWVTGLGHWAFWVNHCLSVHWFQLGHRLASSFRRPQYCLVCPLSLANWPQSLSVINCLSGRPSVWSVCPLSIGLSGSLTVWSLPSVFTLSNIVWPTSLAVFVSLLFLSAVRPSNNWSVVFLRVSHSPVNVRHYHYQYCLGFIHTVRLACLGWAGSGRPSVQLSWAGSLAWAGQWVCHCLAWAGLTGSGHFQLGSTIVIGPSHRHHNNNNCPTTGLGSLGSSVWAGSNWVQLLGSHCHNTTNWANVHRQFNWVN